ncbi:MAG TPA: DMT family transporter [Candidatus Limnocylindrales bacterium]|nr:DMT family transporter [Candidatus Limnocylindrales bacterium]
MLGIVLGTQLVGMVLALAIALARGEPVPHGADLGWSIVAGMAGVIGITALYRGLAVGRMGVVAPTTGVLAAVIPVVVGFTLEGVPRPAVIAGIVTALVAVVLVTRAPSHDDGRASGLPWALASGLMIGLFNVCIGQLSGESAFAPLVVIRLVQAIALTAFILLARQPWRVGRRFLPALVLIGALDMTGNAAFILATQSGQLAIAAVLSSLYPVTTVILAIAIHRERLSRSHLAGIALTAVAIGLIGLGTATL